jgi:hypothetical protein
VVIAYVACQVSCPESQHSQHRHAEPKDERDELLAPSGREREQRDGAHDLVDLVLRPDARDQRREVSGCAEAGGGRALSSLTCSQLLTAGHWAARPGILSRREAPSAQLWYTCTIEPRARRYKPCWHGGTVCRRKAAWPGRGARKGGAQTT